MVTINDLMIIRTTEAAKVGISLERKVAMDQVSKMVDYVITPSVTAIILQVVARAAYMCEVGYEAEVCASDVLGFIEVPVIDGIDSVFDSRRTSFFALLLNELVKDGQGNVVRRLVDALVQHDGIGFEDGVEWLISTKVDDSMDVHAIMCGSPDFDDREIGCGDCLGLADSLIGAYYSGTNGEEFDYLG